MMYFGLGGLSADIPLYLASVQILSALTLLGELGVGGCLLCELRARQVDSQAQVDEKLK